MNNPAIYNYVWEKLKDEQSPHIIQNVIRKDIGLEIGKDAIYEYIWRFHPDWKKYLTRQKKYC